MPQALEGRLVVTAVSDGRLLVEWILDYYRGMRAAVTSVDDEAGIAQVIHSWAEEEPPAPRPRQDLRASAPYELRGTTPSDPEGGVVLVTFTRMGETPVWDPVRERTEDKFAYTVKDFANETNVASAIDAFGSSMASAVARAFGMAQNLAHFRLADGAYLPVLEAYLDRMRSYVEPIDRWIDEVLRRELYPILDQERYLALGKDERARQLMAEIARERSSLYNWFMNSAQGGSTQGRH